MYKNLHAALRGFFITWALGTLSLALAQSPLKAAFVYVAPLTDTGWVRQHETARQAVETQLNANGTRVQTTFVENVAEGADAERVIRDLARQGHQIIFTPSFGYMEPTLRVAAEFPQVKFESITGHKRSTNVATANARYYEGRYLAGIAAGRSTQSGILGYVAGFPIPEVIQGLNAFALGARSVRPDSEVRVIWLQAWFDPARERDAAMTLMNQGADVLAFHTGSNAVMIAAQERGKMAIGYHTDMRKVAPDAQLLAVTHHWGDHYSQRVRALIEGRWQSTDTWGGVREGMVRVEGFGPKLASATRTEVLGRQAELAKGTLQVFKGPMWNDQGLLVVPAGQALTDAQILGMNFRVQGVRSM
jgi:basic membrane protein A